MKLQELYSSLVTRARTTDVEMVPLTDAAGRILADDLYAQFDLPSFNRAALDGYAVCSRDLVGASGDRPVKLKVIGQIEAGEYFPGKIYSGQAVAIATGCPVPEGADAVVRTEETQPEEGIVRVFGPAVKGENIDKLGEDIAAGECIARKGEKVTLGILAMFAALGYSEVPVYKRPNIGLVPLIDPFQSDEEVTRVVRATVAFMSAIIRQNGGACAVHPLQSLSITEAVNLVKDADLAVLCLFRPENGQEAVQFLPRRGRTWLENPEKVFVIASALNTPAIAIQVFNLNFPRELYSIGENVLLPLLSRMSGRSDNKKSVKVEAVKVSPLTPIWSPRSERFR